MQSTVGIERKTVVFGMDGVVIQKFNKGLEGGRTLDATGVTDKYINAGRVIVTDGNGVYKPLAYTSTTSDGVTTKAYSAVPEGFSVCGILYRTVPASDPRASILIDGAVNEGALDVPVTAAIKAALPNVTFNNDENA